MAAARSNGQTLALRFSMAEDEGTKVPQWFLDLPDIGGWNYTNENTLITGYMPDFSNPTFKEEVRRFLNLIGDHYDGHPDIDHIDIGVVGHWGEWHVSQGLQTDNLELPDLDNSKEIIDMHFDAFPNTQLIMLIGAPSRPENGELLSVGDRILEYALSKGAGWRADCFGDYNTSGWNHMENFYMERIEAVASDSWKTAPVAFETCGTVQSWYLNGYDIDQIISDAIFYHTSILNGKSVGIPEEWQSKIDELTKIMGYRLFIKKISHLKHFDFSQTNEISIEIENIGLAPSYENYPFAIRLKSLEDESEFIFLDESIKIKEMLPGEHKFTIRLPRAANLNASLYDISFAFLDPDSLTPIIQFANEEKDIDGWYTLSEVSNLIE